MQVDLSVGGDETWLAYRPTLKEEVFVGGFDEDREENEKGKSGSGGPKLLE